MTRGRSFGSYRSACVIRRISFGVCCTAYVVRRMLYVGSYEYVGGRADRGWSSMGGLRGWLTRGGIMQGRGGRYSEGEREDSES